MFAIKRGDRYGGKGEVLQSLTRSPNLTHWYLSKHAISEVIGYKTRWNALEYILWKENKILGMVSSNLWAEETQ